MKNDTLITRQEYMDLLDVCDNLNDLQINGRRCSLRSVEKLTDAQNLYVLEILMDLERISDKIRNRFK